MKQLNYLLVCFLSIFLVAACNKDADYSDSGNSGDALATFSIKTGGSTYSTRAGQSEESALKSVYIYMFDKENILSSNGEISMNDTTGTSTLTTSLGEKTVYALINGIGNIALPKVVNGVTTTEQFQILLKQTGVLNDDNIAKSGDFLMFGFSTAVITKEEHGSVGKAKENPIMISVNRVSSKVSFVFGTTVGQGNLKGTFSDVKFALNQTHTCVDVFRELRTGGITSSGGEINYTATGPATPGNYDHLTEIASDYKSASTASTDASTFANSHYCLENINENPVTGNSTFVLIKLKFAPKNGKMDEEGDFSNYATTTDLDTSGNFWVITIPTVSGGSLKHIFATEEEASAVVASSLSEGTVEKHTKGVCYYRLNLRDKTILNANQMKERYAVLRNSHYRVNILNINIVGEGNPDELIPDPETPLKDDAYLTANIEILGWTDVIVDEDLN